METMSGAGAKLRRPAHRQSGGNHGKTALETGQHALSGTGGDGELPAPG